MSAESAGMPDLDSGETIRGFIPGQKLFGRYTLLRTLGRGGMGVVWLAQDERLGHEVALKFLPELVRCDSAALDDLKHETRRSLELTHRNIVRIYDFEEDEQSAALAMEYVAGATLSALRVAQQKKVFEPAGLTPWVAEVCDALEYAHHKGKIVHRDLKPANLMIGAQGELKVADFGIARSISESVSRVSLHPPANGTLGYMSPQQALGKPATIRDDIYSLGATLYELLTSRPPFHSGNIQHQLDHVVPPSIAQRRAELEIEGDPIPPAWEATIAACLAKDPAQRPESVSEVRVRLLAPPAAAAADVAGKKAHRSKSPAFWLAVAPVLESWLRIPRFTKLALVAGVVAIVAASSSATYYYAVVRPQAQERERQRIAAVETARREAAEKTRLEKERLAAQALAEARLREEAERVAVQRAAAEKAAEEQRAAEMRRISQTDREALAQSEAQPSAEVADEEVAMTEEEETATPPKARAKKTTRSKSSRTRARPSGFGAKVKRFFGF